MQLNMEQKKLIQAKPTGHSLIRGVAGSGKTTVAVHRAEFLLNHYCIDDSDCILLVTYNRTLVKYLRHLYEKIDADRDVGNLSLFASCSGGKVDRVHIATVDSLMMDSWREASVGRKCSAKLLFQNGQKYRILKLALAEVSKRFPKASLIDQRSASFLLDEIDWIKSCNYSELSEYQNADRLGRMSRQMNEGPQRLMKNSETRLAIFELMQLYDRKLSQEGLLDQKTMAMLVLSEAKRRPSPTYTHIIVDESQDLTRVQLEYLQTLYREKDYSSFVFIADTAQSIYTHSWLVKGRSFASIGFDMTGKSSALSKNYRTTTQIAEAAYSLIAEDAAIVDDEHFVRPALIDRQGSYPVCRCFRTAEAEASFIAQEISSALLGEYQPQDMVVIARLRRQLESVAEVLHQKGVETQFLNGDDGTFEAGKVGLLTMHSIKGLESRVVFIVGLNQGLVPYLSYQDRDDQEAQEITEKKLLYVGMTRASERLYLSSSGKTSKFVRQIDPRYLRLTSEARFSAFRPVRFENYLLADQVDNVYGKEEQVRQWAIRELLERYKFPVKMLSVEFKVNCFSQVGLVDICVSIYRNGQWLPFILVETKAYGSGLDEGFRQLQSYLANCPSAQYGVVTDGNEVMIVDRELRMVDDIPAFDRNMLPSTLEQFEYHCLRRGQVYRMVRDGELPYELSVQGPDGVEEYDRSGLSGVPLYRSIAAGEPIHMQDQAEEHLQLPKDWTEDLGRCYLLQVKGDSMIGAGIDDGDLVLMQQQPTANNRDIVAVALDTEATLKRLMRMGDTVLLIPENEKYEPIHVASDQAVILGVARGLIRKLED